MAVNKVIYGGKTLIDLTADTIKADKLAKGVTAHGADGEPITGTNTFDVDSQDATVQVAEILAGKTAYARGIKLSGTMPNNGSQKGVISTKDGSVTIKQGYHDGSGGVTLDPTEQSKLIPSNIRQGVSILGVEGEMSGTEDANPQAKTVTPSTTEQAILPDEGFNYLSQVTVLPIPYVETDNAAGGKTVTIG